MAVQMRFPMEKLRVTQGYGISCEGVKADTYSHRGSYALDLGGGDTGADWLTAPCGMTVKRIYGSYNAVWFETDDVVEGAGGRAVLLCLHINNSDKTALGLKPGRHFQTGERCYREGRAGNVTGTHVHLEVGKGPFRGTGWHRNAYGVWEINDKLMPHKLLYLAPEVTVINGHGYAWQRAKPATQPQTEILRVGDTVQVIRFTQSGTRRYGYTYEGGRFRLWYPDYLVRAIVGARVVLEKNGVVVAAVNAKDLQKV